MKKADNHSLEEEEDTTQEVSQLCERFWQKHRGHGTGRFMFFTLK